MRERRKEAESVRCRMCGDERLEDAGRVHGYDFLECPTCGLVFTPAVTAETMAELYGEGYHGPEEGAPEQGWADTRFLQPALERFARGEPLRVLDFGTGQSRVPDLLRDEGHRVVAVDVVPPLRPHPDRLTGVLREMALEPDQFDLVFSFQVFEHLPDPAPDLSELLRLARPGGRVLIHTDMEVPEREEGFRSWWYVLPPDHCAFYRHRTFEHALRGTPHSIEWSEPKAVLIRVGEES